jgi:hypothetical protein
MGFAETVRTGSADFADYAAVAVVAVVAELGHAGSEYEIDRRQHLVQSWGAYAAAILG